jgi:glycosyltransferase involved in cell wall biosynthesis
MRRATATEQISHHRHIDSFLTRPNCIQLTTGLTERAGGPYESVAGLTRALADDGRYAPIVAGPVGFFAPRAGDAAHWGDCPIVTGNVSLLGMLSSNSDAFVQRLARCSPSVVHVHSLWDASTLAAMQILEQIDRPLIMSPRGMLEPWALSQRWLKKRIFSVAVMRQVFARVDLFHATSDLEAVSLRNLGLRQPIAIIPNGVDCSLAKQRTGGGAEKKLLYLGRLHVKKGLENLLRAWKAVRPEGWRLVIAGIDEGGYQARLIHLAESLEITDTVDFAGPQLGEEKWSFLSTGDAFVHPSFSENFGIAVAEALAASLPVIATVGTPWRQLQEEQCGWWVLPDVEPLAFAIRDVTALDAMQRAEMGRRGNAFVERSFDWHAIGRTMADVYDWLTGKGPAPSGVLHSQP